MYNTDYYAFMLPSGLRCVHWRTNSKVTYCGIVVNVGAREDDNYPGLAHFVEHTLFKGTARRKSWNIANRMEGIGGDLNAYTSKEETVVYTSAPNGYLERALDLLSDIIGRSNFPEPELEKEKDVIEEEIKSYLDSPSENVYDQFEDMIFAGSQLGHNILGTPNSVRNMNGAICRAFIDKYYVPSNMVLYISDPMKTEKVAKLVEKWFGFLQYPAPIYKRENITCTANFDEKIEGSSHQAHTIVGTRTISRINSQRYALLLLNNYLGGPNMNSLLNRELRDKRGFVYTVDSNVSLLSDTGLMTIYFGADVANVEKCKKLILREIEKLAETAMKPRLFESIKRQYSGQLCVSSDNNESRIMSFAKSILYYGSIHDVDYAMQQVAALRPCDVKNMAQSLLDSGFSTLTLQ